MYICVTTNISYKLYSMNNNNLSNQIENNSSGILNEINSIEEELNFLSDYWTEFLEVSNRIAKDYRDSVNYGEEYSDFLTVNGAMFSDLQHYILLANPDITLICEQYNQFLSIKQRKEDICLEIKEYKLEDNVSLNNKTELINVQIKDVGSYLDQFKELYEKHIENWHLLIDINSTEKLYGNWALFTSAMELYQDRVKLVISPRIFAIMEKMKQGLITVEDLRYSLDYKEIKHFINSVRANKEYLIGVVVDALKNNYPEVSKRKAAKLANVYKSYINDVNNLYEKKYSNIVRRGNIQSSLLYIEDAIKLLKQEFDNVKMMLSV